jgi:hypothetical protein
MAKHSPGRGARAWQVQSVWVKRREGPERVLSAYRFLLDLPPRRAPGIGGPGGLPPRQGRYPAGAEEAAEAASLSSASAELL